MREFWKRTGHFQKSDGTMKVPFHFFENLCRSLTNVSVDHRGGEIMIKEKGKLGSVTSRSDGSDFQ